MGGGVSPAIRTGEKAPCDGTSRRGQTQPGRQRAAAGGWLGGIDRRPDPDPLGGRVARRPHTRDQGPGHPALARYDLDQGEELARYPRNANAGLLTEDPAALRRIPPTSRRSGPDAGGG